MFTTQEVGQVGEETRLVCDFISHDDNALAVFRNASRHFFRSPYRRDEVDGVRHLFTSDATFEEWAKNYISRRVMPRRDPAHDPEAMLRVALTTQAIQRVDWEIIERAWHDWAAGECRINGIYL